MAKSMNKTRVTDHNPMAFIATVENEIRRADAYRMVDIMHEVTG